MRRRESDAGPLLPGEASTILTIVAGSIGLGGAFMLVRLVLALVFAFGGDAKVDLTVTEVIMLVVVAAISVGYCLTGIWLLQARKRGAYLAIGVLGLSVLNGLAGGGRSGFDLLMAIASLVGVALAWPHLSEEGREVEDEVRVTPRARRSQSH